MLICSIGIFQNQPTDIQHNLVDNNLKTLSAPENDTMENHSTLNIDNDKKYYNSLLLEYKKRVGKTYYFNENNHPSDTDGDLKGNVFFAQSTIIPAHNHIEGDVHPHLVSERKTLVIFKPHEQIKQHENIGLKIYNNSNEIYSTELLPPSKLPQIAGEEYDFITLTPDEFSIPETFDLHIDSPEKLVPLVNNLSALNSALSENRIIKLDVYPESSPIELSLDALENHPNRKIILTLMDDVNVKIKRNHKFIQLPIHQSFVVVSDAQGHWHTREEARLSHHYKQVLDNNDKQSLDNNYKKEIPETFDLTIDTNQGIREISNDKNRFHDLIKQNNSIKISMWDGCWARDFYLPKGTQYANKRILFTSEATFHSNIRDDEHGANIFSGDKKLFTSNKNGNWVIGEYIIEESINESPIERTIDFSIPEKFDIKLNTNTEILKVSRDIDYLNQMLIENDNIHIATHNANWGHIFTLETNPKLANKKIYFSSEADFTSHIRYGDNSISLKTNESKLFVADAFGFWRTYEDEPLISKFQETIQYIENGWSITVPKEYIKPKIKFKFSNNNKQGLLSDIKVGAPNKLLINTIDVGVLTPPRGIFTFNSSPEIHRQYFQNIPVNELTVAQYKPIHFKQVMLPTGEWLTDKAPGKGDGHTGILRYYIGDILVSNGINHANFGHNSSSPQYNAFNPYGQVTIHTSIGNYQENGVQVHGWSAWPKMAVATLSNNIGNEVSHELGHVFGLNDYHGGFIGGIHSSANNPNSTWGIDIDNNFFIPNFRKEKESQIVKLGKKANETEVAPPYLEHAMNKDAMSGGSPYNPEYNNFTLHTPSSLAIIQKNFESGVAFYADSTTGYKKWNDKTQKMEDYALPLDENTISLNVDLHDHTDITTDEMNTFFDRSNLIKINSYNGHYTPNIYVPDANGNNKEKIIKITRNSHLQMNLHINGNTSQLRFGENIYFKSNGENWEELSDFVYSKKPEMQNVPVVTLVGYYDPQNKLNGFIAPALECSNGMAYQSDAINKKGTFLRVTLVDGETKNYQLHNKRIVGDKMNKFHINIARSLSPVKSELFIDGKLILSKRIELSDETYFTSVNGVKQ